MKRRQTALLGCLLVIVTGVLYWPAIHSQFVVIDDDLYTYENPSVTPGISRAGLKWALTTTYAANWHPLTWLSHQLDYTLWGSFSGGHHLMSILLHALNGLLLFLLLKRMTVAIWPSFVVAALFAWHPVHVESVAWIAERKDVLSTLFFLLTLFAYARYAELDLKSKVQSPKSKVQSAGFYWLAVLLFVLGLMSKPMLVTLPFILLLLDYWPLKRLSGVQIGNHSPKTTESPQIGQYGTLLQFIRSRLIVEKLPFFALAIAASGITLLAQRGGGAVKSVEEVPLSLRIPNALSAYGHYLLGAIWPTKLCVFYPLPLKAPIIAALISTAVLAALTWATFRARRKQPWGVTGWLWFLGTLVPVIGLVQVGLQARADRYTYIPFIGLFIMLVWGADSFLKRWQGQRRIARILAILALLVCLGLARQQLSYWQDSVALCSRAVAVTTDNAFAHNNLGVALAQQGKLREATAHYAEAVRIKPNYTQARYNLGVELAATGELEQAAVQFSEALKLDAKSEILHNNLGVVLAQQNKTESAIEHFQRAFELNPHYPKPYLNYAVALQQQGEAALAITNYYRALELEPDWPEALDKLAFLLATCPIPQYHDPGKALILALRATELTRRSVPDYFSTLALAYGAVGDLTNAVAAMEMARGQAERKGLQTLSENLNRDLELYRAGKCPEVDWRNPRSQTQSAKPRHETQLRVRHTTGR